MIPLPEDFADFLIELVEAGAEFVVVGGYAVGFHGHPRATKDLDVLVRPSATNAPRVFEALGRFGAPIDAFDITEADFASYDGVLQIGVPPVRIDVLTRIQGVSFDEAIAEAVSFEVDGRAIPVIGLKALLSNKRSTGRLQDLADVEVLESA